MEKPEDLEASMTLSKMLKHKKEELEAS